MRPRRLAAWLLSISGLLTAEARAQNPDPRALAAAQVLYDDAVKGMDKKDYATACPKLEEVVRLVPDGLGAKLSLAECYEGAGRAASAWTMYLVVEELAAKANQEDRRALAQQRGAALKPRLSKLAIAVPAALRPTPGLEVRRDGNAVGPPQWGLVVPVDSGPHEIVVTAAGKRPWKKSVAVEPEGATITIEVGPLEDDAPAPAPAPPFWSAQRVVGAIAGGVGLAGLGVGVAFGLQAIAKKGDAGCDGRVCPDQKGIALFNDAKAAGNLSTAFFVAGGAVLASGAVIFLTAPGRKKTPSVVAAAWPRGIVLEGTW
jgi:hypothetical protein